MGTFVTVAATVEFDAAPPVTVVAVEAPMLLVVVVLCPETGDVVVLPAIGVTDK
ncbi:MAG: hypothetical protein ACYC8U_03785 [Thermoleophilia bacterium]